MNECYIKVKTPKVQGVNEIVPGAMRRRRNLLRRSGCAAALAFEFGHRACIELCPIQGLTSRAALVAEQQLPSVICWAHEAPRLLLLLQDVCTSCAACAAALEGCSGDQSSGLRLLQPREQSCRHVLQLDVMLCMPAHATRALHTWQVSTDSHGWLQMGCTAARACGLKHGSLWSSMENP